MGDDNCARGSEHNRGDRSGPEFDRSETWYEIRRRSGKTLEWHQRMASLRADQEAEEEADDAE